MITSVGPLSPEETLTSESMLGDRIKGWRLVRGMSLEQVSDGTGIPVAVLKIYERGTRKPGGLRMLLIMNLLQLAPADLLYTETGANEGETR